jgi:phosphate transport system substrate-binding protein
LRPTGTLAGIAAFCSGEGPGSPEIVNATRRMREAEVADCTAHGVDGLVEVKVGYDAVALAMVAPGAGAAPVMALGVRDLYLALARRVPDPQGSDRLVSNPYRTWHEVNPELPDTPILVIGSATATGARDTLAELGLEAGCAQVEAVRRITGRNRHRMAELCRPLREDGAWLELSGGDADLAQALRADPKAVAVTGWHALTGNRAGLKTLAVEGVPPSPLAIATGVYALTRPIYVYFKTTNLESLPAVQRYVAEVTSDSAWGEGGYLTAAGMVPMMVDERQKYGYIAEHWVEPACPPFCR